MTSERQLGLVPRRILIIGQDEGITSVFARFLRIYGHHVVDVISSIPASRAAAGHHVPEMILLDVLELNPDHWELLAALRLNPSFGDRPILVASADYFTDATTLERLSSLQVTLRLKPLWPEDLIKLIVELFPEKPLPV